MTKITNFFLNLHNDDDGAAFIEYTALLGIILAVSIAVLGAVGGWADDVWTYLCGQLEDPSSGAAISCP